ncbi:MAG TPA: HD domain-containing phosphohydrolase [Opitutaceae bacterium]|nr:HD domain-containing phosphohydrolase [Opitutaceae bacterium]
MALHLVTDSSNRLSYLRSILEPWHPINPVMLNGGSIESGKFEAVIIAVDLRVVENISALKELIPKIENARKRIFVIEQKSRLLVFQAYALGATRVFSGPVHPPNLLAALANHETANATFDECLFGVEEAASAGVTALASMFASVLDGKPVDVECVEFAASRIADRIADDGLSRWLETVRRHHEGTFQHCLLVTGVAVDFGLSVGLRRMDIQRLYSAAMFHDIGKATIPLAVLDKPGRLDVQERALIETHPAAGYEALRGTIGISLEVLDAVRHHHEYLDGSGYPDALCAANISDIVRILTISDIFAALIQDRRYKPPMPRKQAYEIMCGMHGKLEKPLLSAFKEVALVR